ncbi:MAG: ABC transporter ATP-binding protein [Alkalispirochaeta sp.]
MTEIVLNGVTVGYDAEPVVNELDLRVEAGTLFGLLGPSGCGKTTILRMIAGLLEPDSGEILFDGTSVLHIPPERRRIGMVFQQHVLFPHMTVEENVAFGLRMQGVRLRDARPRVNEVLDLVQLSGYNRRFPKQLSGGQQQRVALARAVVTDPVVLLLDEPLSNLDARLRDDMRSLLRDVQKRLNITTVFVTHDQTEAIELSDRMAVLFTDGIAQEGPPQEVFEHPVNAQVARFLGSTNLIPARWCGDGKTCIETQFGTLVLGALETRGSEYELTVSIRCEYITVNSIGSHGDQSHNTFRGIIDDSLYKGGLIFYRISIEGVSLEVIDRSDRQFVPGAEVAVHFPPEHLWIMP